jgi:hypothetical protein
MRSEGCAYGFETSRVAAIVVCVSLVLRAQDAVDLGVVAKKRMRVPTR